MDAWFHKQNKLVQILLLFIPVINWFTEILVRWSAFLKKGGALRLVISLIVTIGGLFFAWLDMIWVLLFNKLLGE